MRFILVSPYGTKRLLEVLLWVYTKGSCKNFYVFELIQANLKSTYDYLIEVWH